MADRQHHVARIVPALGHSPQAQLLGEIGRGLSGERRIGRPYALTPITVTGRAGDDAAGGIAFVVEPRPVEARRRLRGMYRHGGIMSRDRAPCTIIQPPRDPRHLCMIAPPVGIGFELAFEIAGIKARKSRRAGAIAGAIEAVAGEARIARARLGTAERDDLPVDGKAVMRRGVDRASGQQDGKHEGWRALHGIATNGCPRLFRLSLVALLSLLAACKPPPDQRQFMPVADAANGKAVIERVGCGSCHVIPGIGWPEGAVGPALDRLSDRALIGGALPNRPDLLAAYIRNAPALVPDAAMPAMPVSMSEARDIAAYLYEQGAN